MTTLIDMKLSAEEAKELTKPSPADAPKYPWGLELRLEDDQLTKLGLTSLPSVGTKLQVIARVEVCGTSEHDSQSGAHRCLTLQVTDMALEADTTGKSQADTLYASGSGA